MKLPIHGFVLAGGRSSRMGRDKATICLGGRPMIAIAVETLSAVCECVSIAGSRGDLAEYAAVVEDSRVGEGPAGGMEAGMLACASEWAMFMPVDLPLLPQGFIRRWAEAVLKRPGTRASYIAEGAAAHPALCLLHRDCAMEFMEGIRSGERRLHSLLHSLDGLWVVEASEFAEGQDSSRWFLNVNRPEDLVRAEEAGGSTEGIARRR